MLFTSLEFLLFFLPTVVLINSILPRKVQNIWLFISSLFFYAWGEPFFVIIMMASILLNYLLALSIEKIQKSVIRKVLLTIDITINLGLLFIYKYMNFTTILLKLFIDDIGVTSYIFPIGISFYTFQSLSYVVDVYRGEKAQKSLINVGLYIAFFPQLIAGPIVRYSDIKEQLINRKVTFEDFSSGIYRFLIGFNKKMMLANMLANIADQSFDISSERSVFLAWIGALCYSLQIYFDFSGYSDMAIGLGKLMGFHLPINFNYPYTSKTISEFWRRWHITLGQWFKDYLYFPLGGSKVSSKKRLIFNLMFVWLMTGIWHGANMTFILWGIMYGILISFEKFLSIPSKLENGKCIKRVLYQIFTLLAIMIGWVIFRSEYLDSALWYIQDMFGLGQGNLINKNDIFFIREYGIYIVAGIMFSLTVFKNYISKIKNKNANTYYIIDALVYCINIVLFLVGISYLVISAHNPFIYFNF